MSGYGGWGGGGVGGGNVVEMLKTLYYNNLLETYFVKICK